MKKLFIIIFLVFGVLFNACLQHEGAASETANLKDALNGEWQNISIHIVMHSYKNGDTIKMIQVQEGDWEEKMGIKPILTHFNKEGSYFSEYRNLQDSIIHTPAGQWYVEGDSLFMQETSKDIIAYKVSVLQDTAEFSTFLDWDNDGYADDRYLGIQKKVK